MFLNYLFGLQSWEAIDGDVANVTPDISPLILAAHTDNYITIAALPSSSDVMPALQRRILFGLVQHPVNCQRPGFDQSIKIK